MSVVPRSVVRFPIVAVLGLWCLAPALVPDAVVRADWIDYRQAFHYAGSVEVADSTWKALAQDDGLVCVAAGLEGVVVLDGTDPAHMEQLARYEMPVSAQDIAVRDGYAYVAADELGLVILDLSDPTSPQLASVQLLGRRAMTVELADEYAVVSGAPTDLFFVDVSTPSTPAWAHTIATSGTVEDLEWDEGSHRVYAAEGYYDLLVIDMLSSPPAVVGHGGGANYAISVAAYRDYAYVGSWNSLEFRVYDVSDPSDPQVVATVATGDPVRALEVAGQCLFAGEDGGCLHVYSLYHPEAPDERTYMETVLDVSDLALWEEGAIAYTCGSLSLPSAMLEAIAIPTYVALRPEAELPLANAYTCHADDGYLYVCHDFFDVAIVDLSTFTIAGAIPPFASVCQALYADGDLLHVGVGDGTYAAAWIRDPADPFVIGSLSLPAYAQDIHAEGELVATASGGPSYLIDVSDPEQPELLYSFSYQRDEYWAKGVRLQGPWLFQSGYTSNLHPYLWTIDLQVLEHPVPAAMLELPHTDGGARLDVQGDYAYVAGQLGFYVIDISDPYQPGLVGDLRMPPGETPRIVVEDAIAYITKDEVGCFVVDCSEPTDPVFVGYLRPAEYQTQVALWDDDVYLTASTLDGFVGQFHRHQPGSAAVGDGILAATLPLDLRVAPTVAPASGRSACRLSYRLSQPAAVKLAVYDIGGRCVRRLRDEAMSAGRHRLAWDGCDRHGQPLPSGCYWVRLQAGAMRTAEPVRLIR